MTRHLFDETLFAQITTKKISGITLTDEEANYFRSHLISDDPTIAARCQEIIAELMPKHSTSNSASPEKSLDMEKEYEEILSKITYKKNTSRKVLLTLLLLLLLTLTIAILYFLVIKPGIKKPAHTKVQPNA